jgi:hypothetical protein
MKLCFTFPVIMFFSFFIKILCAQEITDTIDFKILPGGTGFNLKYIDPHFHYNIDKPEFALEQEKRWEKYIFQDRGWKRFNLKESLKPYPDGRKYQIFSSPDDALHYYSASDPIQFGIDFHLKPITGWEKLDIYFFSNGMLVYRYSGDEPWPTILPSKNFLWEVGGGVEYEFSKDWFLFYELSGLFRNQSFIGFMHKAGVRFRF